MGLVPFWAKDLGAGPRRINARSETVSEKPSFRGAFKKRWCLVLAEGFHEWQRTDDGKQPFYIRMRDGLAFAFAGLWENWDRGGGEVRSCSILTTDANGLVLRYTIGCR